MSIAAMNHIWEHSPAKGSELLLLLAIADFADDDGAAFPGVKRLAHKVRMTPRNVQILIRKCEDRGHLTVLQGCGVKTEKGATNLYRLNLRGENFSPHLAQGMKKPTDGVKNPTDGVKPVSPKPSVLNHQLKPPVSDLTPAWEKALAQIRAGMTRATFDFLLAGSELLATTDGYVVQVTSDAARAWLVGRDFERQVLTALAGAGMEVEAVRFETKQLSEQEIKP